MPVTKNLHIFSNAVSHFLTEAASFDSLSPLTTKDIIPSSLLAWAYNEWVLARGVSPSFHLKRKAFMQVVRTTINLNTHGMQGPTPFKVSSHQISVIFFRIRTTFLCLPSRPGFEVLAVDNKSYLTDASGPFTLNPNLLPPNVRADLAIVAKYLSRANYVRDDRHLLHPTKKTQL